MFGFQSKRSKEEEKAGIQFLASMLVCYPEISSLSYEPRRSTLTFEFIDKGRVGLRVGKVGLGGADRLVGVVDQFLRGIDGDAGGIHPMPTGSQPPPAAQISLRG